SWKLTPLCGHCPFTAKIHRVLISAGLGLSVECGVQPRTGIWPLTARKGCRGRVPRGRLLACDKVCRYRYASRRSILQSGPTKCLCCSRDRPDVSSALLVQALLLPSHRILVPALNIEMDTCWRISRRGSN